MAKFTAENQPKNPGRKRGSKGKKSQFSNAMTPQALDVLQDALNNGDQWASEAVLKRTHAPLKRVTLADSLDGEYLSLKMLEISEFEQRLNALEAKHNE